MRQKAREKLGNTQFYYSMCRSIYWLRVVRRVKSRFSFSLELGLVSIKKIASVGDIIGQPLLETNDYQYTQNFSTCRLGPLRVARRGTDCRVC